MRKLLVILLVVIALPTRALAVKVADITRIYGQRTNMLTGLGLVYGLKGTGDGGDFAPAIRPLSTMLSKFADPSVPMLLPLMTTSLLGPPPVSLIRIPRPAPLRRSLPVRSRTSQASAIVCIQLPTCETRSPAKYNR